MYDLVEVKDKTHRIIPSKFPPVSLFDWADSAEEIEQIASLENMTNDRLLMEYGKIHLVAKEDWVYGPGSTPLMSAFTHTGFPSRFSDGSYGVFYTASNLETAIKETSFHRTLFYQASNEAPCAVSMRQYITSIKQPLVNMSATQYVDFLHPNPEHYSHSQKFASHVRDNHQWGLYYPSVRNPDSFCMAIFRPNALSIPVQGCHLKYIWDGRTISEVYKESKIQGVNP